MPIFNNGMINHPLRLESISHLSCLTVNLTALFFQRARSVAMLGDAVQEKPVSHAVKQEIASNIAFKKT